MAQLVTNGNFSKGNEGFDSDYTLVTGRPGSQPNVQPSYAIDKTPTHAANAWGDWGSFGDHTSGSGRMMLDNGGTGDAWREDITLQAGKSYSFSLWARVIDDGSGGTGAPPQLQFFADGQAIGTTLTLGGTDADGWQQLSFTYRPATTTSVVSIQDLNTDPSFNDFALDDISIKGPRAASPAGAAVGAHGYSAAAFDLHHPIAIDHSVIA